MRTSLTRLYAQLIPDAELGMEVRLYRLLCLLGTVLSLGIIIPTNLIARLAPGLTIASAVYGVATMGLFELARRGRYFPGVLAGLQLLVLNVCWFVNAGSMGTTMLFFFSVPMLLTIFYRGWQRWILLGSFLADGLTLIWIHHRFPAWVTPYANSQARLTDLAAGLVVSTLACVLMLWVILENHDTERDRLAQAKANLEQSLQEIRTLQGLIPICSWCKNIRDDEGLWRKMELYISEHSDASFTHGVCPDCTRKHFPEFSEDPQEL